MPQGGYQRPSNPAPVSGPGALSQRTDGGPTQAARYIPGLPYGQGQSTLNMEQSANLAGPNASVPTPNVAAAPTGQTAPQPFTGTPLHAPSERPGEPVTHGAPFGPGGGPEALTHTPVTADPVTADPVARAIRVAYALNPNAWTGIALTQLEQEGR